MELPFRSQAFSENSYAFSKSTKQPVTIASETMPSTQISLSNVVPLESFIPLRPDDLSVGVFDKYRIYLSKLIIQAGSFLDGGHV